MSSSDSDYYHLLALPPTASDSQIRKAYRRATLLYHPDKQPQRTPELDLKWTQITEALAVLTDVERRKEYDNKREARVRREQENEKLEGRRRKLKEDLERGEKEGMGMNGLNTGGAKRTWTQRELDIQRIAEENRRKREAVGRQRAEERRAMEEKERERRQEKEINGSGEAASTSEATALDRSLKVRWIKEAEGLETDQDTLEQSFAAGEVENVVLLKDKKRRVEGRDRKVVLGTAVIIFTSKNAARQAMSRGPWEGIESISWAAEEKGKEES